MKKPIIIGIAGGSASGKSTIVEQIKDRFQDEILVIHHDSYYRDQGDLSFEERVKQNYDHPSSFETDLLIEDLEKLCQGQEVDIPIYDYTIHTRSTETEHLKPKPIIIVEGILILENKDLLQYFDHKIYVDADADVRLARRIVRDMEVRNRSLESVLHQYLETVKPMHEKFVEPSKQHSDIVVMKGGKNKVALQMISEYIESELQKVRGQNS